MTAQRREDLQHIPLDSAYLCADCHMVSNSSLRCPACAGESIMGLAGVLNREPQASEPLLAQAEA